MNHASSEVHSLVFPGERWKLVQWGIDAAQANGVDVSPFRSVLVVHNYGVDHGFAGNGVVIVHGRPGGGASSGSSATRWVTGMGLPHSWSANPDFQYGDGWDVMSFATTTFQFPITFNGTQGAATVGLNARNLEALGAVPTGRSWEPAGPDFSAAADARPAQSAVARQPRAADSADPALCHAARATLSEHVPRRVPSQGRVGPGDPAGRGLSARSANGRQQLLAARHVGAADGEPGVRHAGSQRSHPRLRPSTPRTALRACGSGTFPRAAYARRTPSRGST